MQNLVLRAARVIAWMFAGILVVLTIGGIVFVVLDCRPGHDECMGSVLGTLLRGALAAAVLTPLIHARHQAPDSGEPESN